MGPQKEKPSDDKARQFYQVGWRYGERQPGRVFLNEEEVCRNSGEAFIRPPSPFQRGFRDYAVKPKFRLGKRFGKTPCDVEPYGDYWIVSDRAKQVFDALAKTDFAYLAVDIEADRDTEPAVYWFCDIVPVLDALDEARSVVRALMIHKDGSKIHDTGKCSLVFDETIVGQHCIFRMRTSFMTLICNERFMTAVKQAKLTGLSFWDAFEPPFDKIGTVTALPPFGKIKPQGRGAEIFFHQKQLEALGVPLRIGQTVRAQCRRNRYGYSATHLEII
jgi:cold shock CspA family protein